MSSSLGVMTEAEAAVRLKCSVPKLRKLRASGQLAFIPGRPVLILERDFLDLERREAEAAYARWQQRKTRKRATKPPKPTEDPDVVTRRHAAMSWLKMRSRAGLPLPTKPIRY